MSIAAETENLLVGHDVEPVGVAVLLDAPGTYICNWSGHLLRVPEANPGSSRFAHVVRSSPDSWTVTRISPDPHISRFEAKALADSLGLDTNF